MRSPLLIFIVYSGAVEFKGTRLVGSVGEVAITFKVRGKDRVRGVTTTGNLVFTIGQGTKSRPHLRTERRRGASAGKRSGRIFAVLALTLGIPSERMITAGTVLVGEGPGIGGAVVHNGRCHGGTIIIIIIIIETVGAVGRRGNPIVVTL
jgi:hypothetical protein